MSADAGGDVHLDGNAAAGLLGQLFTFEVTAAAATCDGCGLVTPVGGLVFYDHEMGAILRCPGCGAAMIRATQLGGVWRIDMRGVQLLRVDSAP